MSQTPNDAAQAFRQAFAVTTTGELSFPTSLDASQRVLKAVERPDLSLAALARIIIAEPLLSAKVMRLANSVALNPDNKAVLDLRHAVLCVGIDITKALAMVLILDQLRQAQRHNASRDLANRLWERSVHVAALSYVLAKKLTRINPDEAMFAAIVRDLGRFYLLARAADYPALQDDLGVLAQVVNDLASDATALVLDKLHLPAPIVDSVLAADACSTPVANPGIGDVLHIASLVSPRGDPFDELDPRIDHEAVQPLPAGFDQRAVNDLVVDSGNEIYSIIVALES